MRTMALVLLMMTTVSGCVSEGSAVATVKRLGPLMTEHAAALAGNDVPLMRQTGRKVISTYDAGVGPQ